ncbi:putative mitochondrial import inner membrane translocase subunit TIM22 [Helianthus anomalus]
MKRLRGKEDVHIIMIAALGSEVMYSLVSGMGAPNPAANAVKSGVEKKFSKSRAEDVLYSETRSMLFRLGLENYEKNFKN